MRGPSKSLPKYRKHKRSGQAVVTLSGHDIYLGPYGTEASKIEYDRIIGEWLANGRKLKSKADEKQISVVELCAAYLRFCKEYYVKDGMPTDEQIAVKISIRHINALHADVPATDFGPIALESVRQRMIKSGNSRRYINQNVGRLKRMFRWGVSKELIPAKTYQSLITVSGLKRGKTAAREPDPIFPISKEVVDATLLHCSKQIADMIRIQFLTGCRPGEICSMKPSEIDQTRKIWRYIPSSHKMEHKDRSRVILIGPRAQEILLPYLQRDASAACFERPSGGPFKRWNYSDKINLACDKAFPAPEGLNDDEAKEWRKQHRWAPNRLRHSRATEIRSLFGIEDSQVVLGHSKADTTQIYAERDIERAAQIMSEVG